MFILVAKKSVLRFVVAGLALMFCGAAHDKGPVAPASKPAGSRVRVVALMRVLPRNPILIEEGSIREFSKEEFSIYKSSQAVLYTSPLVLRTALRDPSVKDLSILKSQPNTMAWMRNQIQIEFPRDSAIMEVSVSGDNAEELTTLMQAMQKAYLNEVANLETDDLHREVTDLKYKRDKYRESLTKLIGSVRELEKQGAERPEAAMELKMWREEMESLLGILRKINAGILARETNVYAQPRVRCLLNPMVIGTENGTEKGTSRPEKGTSLISGKRVDGTTISSEN